VVDVTDVLSDFDLRSDTAVAPARVPATTFRETTTGAVIYELDRRSIEFARKAYPLVARTALFVVFFWFGFIKLLDLSPATGLAMALTTKTVGMSHFETLFNGLAVFECVIGVLFLIPRMVRVVLALVCIHMAVVCAPLVLVPSYTWQGVMVPTMDGQYIIKNVLIVAAAIGLAAHASPRGQMSTARSE
jgi:uncharacterized membrane protein YphA (DoxX/SURF4 family)